MRIIISGDVNRPGQTTNIARLADLAGPAIAEAFDSRPEIHGRTPLPFESWVKGYDDGPFPSFGADLLIGFELPPAARRRLLRWIDVRRHPVRFHGEVWTLASDIDAVMEAINSHGILLEKPEPREKVAGQAVIALQVHSDAALIRNGRLIQPEDVIEHLWKWSAEVGRILVCPHPLEPQSPWMAPVLRALPEAEIAFVSTYQALAESVAMATVSSSTGVEARYFDCEPTFLWREPEHGPAVDIRSVELWKAIAEAVR